MLASAANIDDVLGAAVLGCWLPGMLAGGLPGGVVE